MPVALPIDSHLPVVLAALSETKVVILSAAPGSGKTTRIPPALMALTPKKVVVLQPRRVAASMAAYRIAEEMQWECGREVGFQVRHENRTSSETKLVFVTEALLLKWIQRDSELSEVGIVVIDEFHERSIHVDVALALLRDLAEIRDDLKIVVMSATLNSQGLESYWPQSKAIHVPVVSHPLKLIKDKKAQLLRPSPEWYDRLLAAVDLAIKESPGQKDILVFMPGVREMTQLAERLGQTSASLQKGLSVHLLHAQLPIDQQRAVLAGTHMPVSRRIILTTNVAESAVTVNGVDTVVDSGLERINQLHVQTGNQSLELVRISKSSARQRAGRAARQGPGLVIQLWSQLDEMSLPQERTAEIHRTELSELVLQLAGQGYRKPFDLSWYEKPPERTVLAAQTLLRQLGALSIDGSVTPKGVRMLELSLHPRWASLVVECEDVGERDMALTFGALIQAPAERRRSGHMLELYDDFMAQPSRFPQARRILLDLQRQAKAIARMKAPTGTPRTPGELLWLCFPDRLCKRRSQSETKAGDYGRMIGGRGVRLPREAAHAKFDFFLALELVEGLSATDSQCAIYFPLSDDEVNGLIRPLARASEALDFDEGVGVVYAHAGLFIEDLQIDKATRRPADGPAASTHLARHIVSQWTRYQVAWPELANWLGRYRYWCSRVRPEGWPIKEEQLKSAVEWACEGENRLSSVEKKDWSFFLGSQVFESTNQRQEFDKVCPRFLQSPRGRTLEVQYAEGSSPLVALRIQDAFGWAQSPMILGEPFIVELLAPNGRPAQRTQDLNSFWRNSYKDVRKELRARYPKHAWPEDPLTYVAKS